jgi:hypothetical protein
MSPVQEEEESDIELNYDAPTTTAPEDAFFKNFQASRLTKNIHEIGVALNSRRKAAPDTIIGAATAWIDRDDSGTYDPDAERVRSTARRNKRVRVVGSGNKDDAPKSRKKNRPPETLVLKFANEKSLDYLRSITPDSEVPGSSSANELSDSEDSEGDSGIGSRRTRRKPKQPKRFGIVEERFVKSQDVSNSCTNTNIEKMALHLKISQRVIHNGEVAKLASCMATTIAPLLSMPSNIHALNVTTPTWNVSSLSHQSSRNLARHARENELPALTEMTAEKGLTLAKPASTTMKSAALLQ